MNYFNISVHIYHTLYTKAVVCTLKTEPCLIAESDVHWLFVPKTNSLYIGPTNYARDVHTIK